MRTRVRGLDLARAGTFLLAIGLTVLVNGREARDTFLADEWEHPDYEPRRDPVSLGRAVATEMWTEVEENNLASDGSGPTPW